MKLMHTYPAVMRNGAVSFGGDQRAGNDPVIRRCGCGVVAVTDLLLYLHRWHDDCFIPPLRNLPQDVVLEQEQYERILFHVRQKYIPLVHPFGTNGFALAAGINRFFKRHGVPCKASWGVPRALFWETMEQMLSEDIPVILSVGMNFPKVWERERLNFYRGNEENPVVSNRVRAHFVVVTGLDKEWMQISTWGKLRYIRRAEYETFRRHCSGTLLSNLLYVRKI